MFRKVATESKVIVSPEWSICLTERDPNGGTQKRVVWTGRQNTAPSSSVLSEVLDQELPDESLQDVAVQVCKLASTQALPTLLTSLSCTYWRRFRPNSSAVIDVTRLQELSESGTRSVCGRVFEQGDIVWTCRQCGKDPTCVQCDQCFRKSDHVGHEVYFHRASGGGSGCCDCGDEEAWCRAGNCIHHNHPSRDQHGPTNPLEGLPAELERGARTVIRGVVGLVASYVICVVRGFANAPVNSFVEEMSVRREPMVVRLHNDDVHTFNDVSAALRTFGLTATASEQFTVKVDKEGEAVVLTEARPDASELLSAHVQFVEQAGLLVSMAPQSVVQLEPRVAAVFEWFRTMGALNEGLRRIIVEELVAQLTSTTSCLLDPPAGATNSAEWDDLNQGYTAVQAFDDPAQFPSVMLHLQKLPDGLELVAPVDLAVTDAVSASASTVKADAEATREPPRAPRTDYGESFAERIRHPFRRCHRDALALLLLGSPYLPNSIKRAINDLVIHFQHDPVFKATFSQQLTTLYPALFVLHCRNIGTAEQTIFHTTVQVYTANSVVAMVSSDGAGSPLRLLPEGDRPLMATPLLAATLQTVLLDTGCLSVSASASATVDQCAAFLAHHAVRTHRLSHVCRDFEYLAADYGFCTRLLAEDVDKGAVRKITLIQL
jgi:ATP-dependent Clp protease adapter protein ClpS